MLRMSRLTDYGTVILSQMAEAGGELQTTASLAELTHLAQTTVSKVLKALTRAGLVSSVRGPHGGYTLARPPTEISAAAIIDALEGPVAITECAGADSRCELEAFCGVGNAWQRINVAIRRALDQITLAELATRPRGWIPPLDLRGASGTRID